MMVSVKQSFAVMDKFGAKYKVAQVELIGAPTWVDPLVSSCTALDIRYALDRHPDPLIRTFRYTPSQCLDRIPKAHLPCTIRKGCFGWAEKKCNTYKTNACALLSVPDIKGLADRGLTELVNLWREDNYVVIVSSDSP